MRKMEMKLHVATAAARREKMSLNINKFNIDSQIKCK